MTLNTTAIAFISSFLGLSICGSFFLQAFRKRGGLKGGNRTSFLLLLLIFSTAFQHGILAIGHLFFYDFPKGIHTTLALGNIFLAFAAVFGIYFVFYLLLPKISPWPATILVSLLGIIMAVATWITDFSPFIDSGKSIDWNYPRWLELLIYLVLLVNIGSLLSGFLAVFFQTRSRSAKLIALTMVVVTSLGMVNIFLRFVLLPTTVGSLRTSIFDVILIIIGILLILGLLFIPVVRKWIPD